MSHDERRDRDDLHELFQDAVSDVDPAHRLDEIRARTRKRDLRGWYAAGGAALLAAAAVALVAIVGPSASDSAEPGAPSGTSCDVLQFYGGPAGQPISTPTSDVCSSVGPSPTQSTGASASSTPTSSGTTSQIYYVGNAPTGPRLFGELTTLADNEEAGLVSAITSDPDDADYRTLWPRGSILSITPVDELATDGRHIESMHIDVHVAQDAPRSRLADQQVVYSLRAAYGGDRLPGQPWPSVRIYDGTVSTPAATVSPEPEDQVLALVNIVSPAEGQHVSGSFTARGVADSFEGTVGWEIRDARGKRVLAYSAQAASGIRLSPWRTTIDVSKLAPGTYTFVASTDDPTGGEGPGPTTDTRTIVVE